jgi:hypothetical protein
MRTLVSLLSVSLLIACTHAPVAKRPTSQVAEPSPEPKRPLAPEDELADFPERDDAVLTAVAPRPTVPPPTMIEEELVEEEDPTCPMSVPGTTVAFVETSTGAMLLFEAAHPDEVQRRLEARFAGSTEASVELDGTSVRVVFSANPERLARLREEVRGESLLMARGRCSAPR